MIVGPNNINKYTPSTLDYELKEVGAGFLNADNWVYDIIVDCYIVVLLTGMISSLNGMIHLS